MKLDCDCGREPGKHTKLDCGVPLPATREKVVKRRSAKRAHEMRVASRAGTCGRDDTVTIPRDGESAVEGRGSRHDPRGLPMIGGFPTSEMKSLVYKSKEADFQVLLTPTKNGGLQIKDGKTIEVLVEVLPDGTIKGDAARALRMLAAALATMASWTDDEGSK